MGTLLEEEEPEFCDLLWENLEDPLKMFYRHPVSTGEEFSTTVDRVLLEVKIKDELEDLLWS